jgi:antitoxin HigA-1
MTNKLDPVHPGEVLLEEFIRPLGLSQYRLAKDMNVPARRINEIVKRERSITADTALRLARFFGTSEMFWLNLQARYDLDVEKDRLGKRLVREVGHFAAPVATRQVSLQRGTFSRRIATKKR